MTLAEILPHSNAALNATSALLIFVAWRAIRGGDRRLHRNCMIAACVASGLFLAGYLTRHALVGTRYFADDGAWKAIYLALLFSHMALAATVPPLVFRAIFLATRGRYAEHRRLTRYALPIWSYVSVTGVVVYGMLYHWPVS